MPAPALNPAASQLALRSGFSRAKLRAFWQLTKPRVMSLVLFTGLAGAVAAPGGSLSVIIPTLFFMALGAGAAGALNMWYERGLDARMSRTSARPLPAGMVSPAAALVFALSLAVVALAGMALWVNYLAASLLALTIFFYLVIYTMWLKPRTAQNIVIGGAAGAFPPMIGWAGVAGTITPEAFYLFLIIFLWTPPHFWALALYRVQDYEKANLPMLPNEAGSVATCRQILLYNALLVPASLMPFLHGGRGWLYAAVALLLSGEFFRRAWALYQLRHDETAMQSRARGLFGFSLIYLFALFSALLVEEGLFALMRL